VHEVRREEVRLLVVAARRHLAGGALHDDAAVERGDLAELLGRHAVVDHRLHCVDVRREESPGSPVRSTGRATWTRCVTSRRWSRSTPAGAVS
jgi:hypothetical protein